MDVATTIATNMPSLLSAITSTDTRAQSAAASSLFGPSVISAGAASVQTEAATPIALASETLFKASIPARTTPSLSPAARRQEQQVLTYAAKLVESGRYRQAQTALQAFLDQHRSSGRTVRALGVVAMEQREYAKAERLFRQADFMLPERGYGDDAETAAVLQKDDAAVFRAAQGMLQSSDTAERGVSLLIGLTQRNPLHTEARIELAEALLRRQDAANALTQFRMALMTADEKQLTRLEGRLSELSEKAPKLAYLRRLVGQTQLRLGKAEKAAQTLAEATALADGDASYRAEEAPAHLAIGHEKLERGDIAGALASFETAQSLDFGSPEVREALGEAYLERGALCVRTGSVAAGIADLNTAAGKLRSSDDEALRKRLASIAFSAGVRLESAHLQQGEQIGDEETAFRIAFDMGGDNAVYRDKWAQLSSRIGDEFLAEERYEEAAEAYLRASALFPRNETYRESAVGALMLFGDEQLGLKEYDEAISAYQRAYELGQGEAGRLKLAGAFNARGLHFLELQDLSQARRDFNRALYYDPGNTQYEENRTAAGG